MTADNPHYPRLTVGSLFSGIGGLDLGLERAGMRVVWQSEIDPYCRRVLAKHWPHVPNLGDVTAIDWSTVERPDLVCGGYPCQPFSFAGNRGGTSDARHLWPHMRYALGVLRPEWAVLENVPGHVSLGLDTVLADLAGLGFHAQWSLVSACSMGAPHMRERLFVLAHAAKHQLHVRDYHRVCPSNGAQPKRQPGGSGGHADGSGRGWWESEPNVARVAHGVSNRVDRLRALGNAVVPQVAEYVGRCILEAAS
jgi:DNA (cytosine-5)-methyltransferase 1